MKLAEITENEAKALARLSQNDDFRIVTQWLSRSREEIRNQNDKQQDDVLLRHGQGASQVITQLNEAIANAPDLLRRFQK